MVRASSGVSKLPKPRSMEVLENSTEEDSFADCCPWLELTRCQCNCTNFPTLGNVLVDCHTPVADPVDDSGDSWDEDEEEDVQIHQEENDIEEASDEEEESVPMFTEYVALRDSSFHEDCQSTLKKCRELLCAKRAVELRVLPEPNNIRDCNALIIQAKVENQWDRIGYIPKEKVPKFTSAIRNNELKDVKFRNIKCHYVMLDTSVWTFLHQLLSPRL